ncbi:MAG: aminotransferase class IV [Candidatus Omnitrophica bacterium]|nr:aminotransferase class IV [Candidatus Omnitrophota bacterium]
MFVYHDKKYIGQEELNEVFEPGYLFGWGAFESFRAYEGKPAFLDEHIERLQKAIDVIGLDKLNEDWEQVVRGMLEKNNLNNAYIRINVYKKREGTGLIVYANEFGYYKKEIYDAGFKLGGSEYIREENKFSGHIKSLSYMINRLAWHDAQKKKKDEAVMCNRNGMVVGGSRSNIFIVRGDRIFTPSLSSGAFNGITRKKVFDICFNTGIFIEEGDFDKEGLLNADEVFLTSSLLEIMPVSGIDDKSFFDTGSGRMTKKIHSLYCEKLRSL